MAKGQRGSQTRDDIVLTAGRLFALHGYYHTSTQDILEALSLSKGAFYYHFRSKEDLALAVLGQLRSDYETAVVAAVRSAEPALRFEVMMDRIIELNQSGQWYNCLLLSRLVLERAQDKDRLSQQVRDILNWMMDIWREVIVDSQSAGTIQNELDPDALSGLIFTTLFGTVACRELDDHIVNLKQIAGQIKLLITP
ncbi:MAG: TetR/AcrR family transcriptional regulator [Sedimentisphaerales bacterium]|nr:TetR/AcrR family transcriptional regulator [Sedimentisphaerales bacterium]